MYTDAQILGQFRLLEKSCRARGFTLDEHLVLREQGTGRLAFLGTSCLHAQGFLDGLDYARRSAASAENENKTDQNRPAS